MTTTHHPSEALLLDYASGAAHEPVALLIATHATLCPACRAAIATFERAGGALVDAGTADAAAAIGDTAGDRLKEAIMVRLDEPPQPESVAIAPAGGAADLLPAPLRRYAGAAVAGNRWRRWGPGVRQIRLLEGRRDATVRLARIRAGARMPVHSHGGEEYTLVLSGGFSDATGHFLRGDLAEMGTEDIHQPVADAGEDCICLIVSSAPLRLRGMAGALLNPFIRD